MIVDNLRYFKTSFTNCFFQVFTLRWCVITWNIYNRVYYVTLFIHSFIHCWFFTHTHTQNATNTTNHKQPKCYQILIKRKHILKNLNCFFSQNTDCVFFEKTKTLKKIQCVAKKKTEIRQTCV